MKRKDPIRIVFVLISLSFFLSNCQTNSNSILGPIIYPSDNQFHPEIAKLGKKLFFDKRLSLDNTVSCASCHLLGKAFTDGKKFSTGVHGRLSMRNAPSLFNVAYQSKFMADGGVPTLEMQALVPLKDTAEMANDLKILLAKLNAIPDYQKAAKKLFHRDFDAYVLTRSLANFERTLISANSSFDRFFYGKHDNAISQEAKQGWVVFSKELYCIKCHTPPLFSNLKIENNGLYKDYMGMNDKGRYRITGNAEDIGSFKVPSLRNIGLTAPFMHDGSLSTLDQVLDFYSRGGNKSEQQNSLIKPFVLTDKKRKALKSFLMSLEETK